MIHIYDPSLSIYLSMDMIESHHGGNISKKSMKSSLISFSRNVESMLPRLRDLLIGAMGLLVI